MPEGASTPIATPTDQPTVACGPIPGSAKVYVDDPALPRVRVAMRRILLTPQAGEPPLVLYDTSGPYTDPAAAIDIAAGLPPLLAAGLSRLTPLSFLVSSARNCRQLLDYCAFTFGVVLGQLLAWYQLGLDLMWSGIIGGVAAYGIHRVREATR